MRDYFWDVPGLPQTWHNRSKNRKIANFAIIITVIVLDSTAR